MSTLSSPALPQPVPLASRGFLWTDCHAKRLECDQLAGAVLRWRRLESGSKLHALQTLRAVKPHGTPQCLGPPSGASLLQARHKREASLMQARMSGVVFVFPSYSHGVSMVFSWCFLRVCAPSAFAVRGSL